MTDKALVIDAIRRLPDSSTLADIRAEVDFIAGVRLGLEQARRGETVSLSETAKKIDRWATKSS